MPKKPLEIKYKLMDRMIVYSGKGYDKTSKFAKRVKTIQRIKKTCYQVDGQNYWIKDLTLRGRDDNTIDRIAPYTPEKWEPSRRFLEKNKIIKIISKTDFSLMPYDKIKIIKSLIDESIKETYENLIEFISSPEGMTPKQIDRELKDVGINPEDAYQRLLISLKEKVKDGKTN